VVRAKKIPPGGGTFLLLLLSVRVYLPFFAVGAEDYFAVCVLQGDVVAVQVISGEFEQFSDPVSAVVAFQAHQQAHGQLRGGDVAGDS